MHVVSLMSSFAAAAAALTLVYGVRDAWRRGGSVASAGSPERNAAGVRQRDPQTSIEHWLVKFARVVTRVSDGLFWSPRWTALEEVYDKAHRRRILAPAQVLPTIVAGGAAMGLLIAAVGLALSIPPATVAPIVLALAAPIIAWMTWRAQARENQQDVFRQLPWGLDTMVMMLRAGAPPHEAIREVSRVDQGSALGEEFALVDAAIRLGTPRIEALETMADRVGLHEVDQFVRCLATAERLGHEPADAIERLSRRVRTMRWQQCERAAQRAGFLMLIPSLLVFLANIIIMLGPLAIYLLTASKHF